VLFETNYGTSYDPVDYLVFIFLGVAGGLFGGVFCKANFLWSRTFRKYRIIKNSPVLEVFLVVLATALLQYPNPLTREAGDITIKNLLVNCRGASEASWVCQREALPNTSGYVFWLIYGTFIKLVLTIITFGCKVPSGIIIPALDGGALFGRLVEQLVPHASPGIFAMIGAGAFLAGVSRMTLSLCVIMFELTGELEYVVPHMIAIMVAKWVADTLEPEGVYDLAQAVLGHPFLDFDHAIALARARADLVDAVIPPQQTMEEITVSVGRDGNVPRHVLKEKLMLLKRRGLMDAGLVLTRSGMLLGYLPEAELAFGLAALEEHQSMVDMLDGPLAAFVDRTPLTLSREAPMEYLVEMFCKLGLRYLIVVEGSETAARKGEVCGVVIKKRLLWYLEELRH
jgi:chloride channel 3/4/5